MLGMVSKRKSRMQKDSRTLMRFCRFSTALGVGPWFMCVLLVVVARRLVLTKRRR